MYRAALRSSSASLARAARQPVLAGGARRMLTTAPASKKPTWKGAFARWGVAIGAVYWYSTSPIFADEASKQLISAPPPVPEPELPSVDAVLEEKRKHEAAVAEKLAREAAEAEKNKAEGKEAAAEDAQSVEALEGEASQQGAFNPETGEINWDCPCLGGMAHGPCGEEFKSAFSCFVYSEQEPKGMDCIDKFQHMQDCFRLHPDVYGAELTDEEEGEAGVAAAAAEGAAPATIEAGEAVEAKAVPVAEAETKASSPVAKEVKAKEVKAKETKEVKAKDDKPKPETKAKAKTAKAPAEAPASTASTTGTPESDEHIPTAAHDATAGRK